MAAPHAFLSRSDEHDGARHRTPRWWYRRARSAVGARAASEPQSDLTLAPTSNAAAAVGRRAAELAAKSGGVSALTGDGGAVATLSQFERRFKIAWANGKGAKSPEALREVLQLLPAGAAELSSFVKEGLTDELLSGLVLASEVSGEPPAEAAARLGALATVRRFDMAWMMAGKAEKKAASSLFLAAAVSDPCAELAEAAKKYGVEI